MKYDTICARLWSGDIVGVVLCERSVGHRGAEDNALVLWSDTSMGWHERSFVERHARSSISVTECQRDRAIPPL